MTLPRLAALFRFSSDYLRGTGLVLALIADALDEQEHADTPAREEGERADADVSAWIDVGSMRVVSVNGNPAPTVAEIREAIDSMRDRFRDEADRAEQARFGLGPCSDPDCSTCKPN